MATKKFENLKERENKKALKGIRKRDWNRVLKEAGFGSRVFRTQFKYGSGFTHSGGMTTAQVMTIRDRAEQKEFADTELQKILILMAKMILDYLTLHPETQYVVEKYPEVMERVRFWDDTVAGMS
jgi:hypothetical protein